MTSKASRRRSANRRHKSDGTKSQFKYIMTKIWKNPYVQDVVNAGSAVVLLLGLLCLIRHHIRLYMEELDLPYENWKWVARETIAVLLIVLYVFAEGASRAKLGFMTVLRYSGAGLCVLASVLDRIGKFLSGR